MEERAKIKIVIATGLYPPDIGGPATYVKMLEEHLPVHDYQIEVVAFGSVRHLPKIVRHGVYAWRLWKQSQVADVIYALDPVSVGLPALLISRLRRVPFMVRLGGDYAWEQGQQRFGVTATLDEYTSDRKSAALPVRVLARLQSFVVSRAVSVVVPSKYLGSVVESWGVVPEKINVIYSVLHPLPVVDTKEVLRTQLSYTGPTLVSAGRLVPWKGFKALIEVASRLQSEYPKLTLVIAGSGPENDVLKEYAQTQGVSESVRFVGSLSKDALGAVIKAADVFVLNTAYEGLSHLLLEVMDIGTPIITTDVGGNPELITDGVTGSMVPFNDISLLEEALKKVLAADNQAVIDAARLRTRDFSAPVTVSQLADHIRTKIYKTYGDC